MLESKSDERRFGKHFLRNMLIGLVFAFLLLLSPSTEFFAVLIFIYLAFETYYFMKNEFQKNNPAENEPAKKTTGVGKWILLSNIPIAGAIFLVLYFQFLSLPYDYRFGRFLTDSDYILFLFSYYVAITILVASSIPPRNPLTGILFSLPIHAFILLLMENFIPYDGFGGLVFLIEGVLFAIAYIILSLLSYFFLPTIIQGVKKNQDVFDFPPRN